MKILSPIVFQHGVFVSINLEVTSVIVIVGQGHWEPLLADILVPSPPGHRPIMEHHHLDRVGAVVARTLEAETCTLIHRDHVINLRYQHQSQRALTSTYTTNENAAFVFIVFSTCDVTKKPRGSNPIC